MNSIYLYYSSVIHRLEAEVLLHLEKYIVGFKCILRYFVSVSLSLVKSSIVVCVCSGMW